MGVINQNISSSMNKSEANCCVLPVKKGKLWDDSSMIFLNCLELFENKYILLNFTELSANNYDQHPLLVNKCKVNSVSRAHCSSTVQFCLIQLAKLFGKNKEKNSFCQSVVVYTNYFGVASEEISGVKTCQCGATHCDDPL